ncbi:Gmad2 immunoglobulin-like domain-containing protein [Arthrobacter sp. PAMC25284]|uniref:Gmad2 immunoglobulin-like domain-containing protein n=1 Tax=Arthrobacter sp. PAMC25284 TaxID=2861279 RepID=UPI001C636E83|nr:Gmad2 immunoglobulin-like domain-containing protein [Arthrobacter sp. PAMC25284]QYF88876.1 Gmad2 immunoglobulin-like domain-containing protein [Arthrobacter sp. PAMC25284]
MKELHAFLIGLVMLAGLGLMGPPAATAAPRCSIDWGSLLDISGQVTEARIVEVRAAALRCYTRLLTGEDGVSDAEAATIVYPKPGGSVRFDDPRDLAGSFAVDLVGFTDPLISDFMQGDSRSGEFAVRAEENGPVTTVLVRQMSDQQWYVLGATTSDIEVTVPGPGANVDSPVQVAGQARAFEGTVRVTVHGRGWDEPVGEGFVTASGGPELGPFSGEIGFTKHGGRGSVLFTIDSARDGSVWQAAAVPVGFAAGC